MFPGGEQMGNVGGILLYGFIHCSEAGEIDERCHTTAGVVPASAPGITGCRRSQILLVVSNRLSGLLQKSVTAPGEDGLERFLLARLETGRRHDTGHHAFSRSVYECA